METLPVFILVIWGMLVAFLEERFGVFQDLSPRAKQLVNAALAYVVPVIVGFLTPIWRPELGDANEVVTAVIILLVPAIAWLASQLGHQTDRLLQNAGDKLSK
jgi:hypothetical protein